MPVIRKLNNYQYTNWFACPNCGKLLKEGTLKVGEGKACHHCGAITSRITLGDVAIKLADKPTKPTKPTLTIWDNKGRELVCHKATCLPENRIGMYCFVAPFQGKNHKNFVHVYFEDRNFNGPCYFFYAKEWWACPVPLLGSIATVPPRDLIIRARIAQLELELFELKKETQNED